MSPIITIISLKTFLAIVWLPLRPWAQFNKTCKVMFLYVIPKGSSEFGFWFNLMFSMGLSYVACVMLSCDLYFYVFSRFDKVEHWWMYFLHLPMCPFMLYYNYWSVNGKPNLHPCDEANFIMMFMFKIFLIYWVFLCLCSLEKVVSYLLF